MIGTNHSQRSRQNSTRPLIMISKDLDYYSLSIYIDQ